MKDLLTNLDILRIAAAVIRLRRDEEVFERGLYERGIFDFYKFCISLSDVDSHVGHSGDTSRVYDWLHRHVSNGLALGAYGSFSDDRQ